MTTIPSNISWYWRRLRKLSAAEIPYRVGQSVKKRIDKLRDRPIASTHIREGEPNLVSSDIETFRLLFPSDLSLVTNAADEILRHQFCIFGIEKHFGEQIDWHLDPKTGNRWPLIFWGDIDYRDGHTVGGIKFAWELNRFHHLPKLALAYSLTGSDKYRREIFEQLQSWLRANPYPQGINWISGIELGIRIVNIVYTLKLLVGAQLGLHERRLIDEFVWLHGYHLYRYPSKYSSCANHALAEALGLFVAGLCFPYFKQADKWKQFGKAVLDREVTRQIYPDGSSFEHSIPYLQFVVDHYLVYFLLCNEHSEACNGNVGKRLQSARQFIAAVSDKRSNVPLIGDDDDGYLLKLWIGEHNNFKSLSNTCGLLFVDPELSGLDNRLDHKTVLLMGAQCRQRLCDKHFQKNRVMPDSSTKFFKNAGLAVVAGNKPREFLFVGNSGPLGLAPLAGHGHADALSFWLSVQGQPIFVDPGTYLYHSGGKWRDYFRSTRAHNTIKVDGQDQAAIIADFMFDDFYAVEDADFQETEEEVRWQATHTGYTRLADPVLHKRIVTFRKTNGHLSVRDNLECKQEHAVECNFHLHPGCSARREDDCILLNWHGGEADMKLDKKWAAIRIVQGEATPLRGWYSPRFNCLEPTTTIVAESVIHGSETFHCSISF